MSRSPARKQASPLSASAGGKNHLPLYEGDWQPGMEVPSPGTPLSPRQAGQQSPTCPPPGDVCLRVERASVKAEGYEGSVCRFGELEGTMQRASPSIWQTGKLRPMEVRNLLGFLHSLPTPRCLSRLLKRGTGCEPTGQELRSSAWREGWWWCEQRQLGCAEGDADVAPSPRAPSQASPVQKDTCGVRKPAVSPLAQWSTGHSGVLAPLH